MVVVEEVVATRRKRAPPEAVVIDEEISVVFADEDQKRRRDEIFEARDRRDREKADKRERKREAEEAAKAQRKEARRRETIDKIMTVVDETKQMLKEMRERTAGIDPREVLLRTKLQEFAKRRIMDGHPPYDGEVPEYDGSCGACHSHLLLTEATIWGGVDTTRWICRRCIFFSCDGSFLTYRDRLDALRGEVVAKLSVLRQLAHGRPVSVEVERLVDTRRVLEEASRALRANLGGEPGGEGDIDPKSTEEVESWVFLEDALPTIATPRTMGTKNVITDAKRIRTRVCGQYIRMFSAEPSDQTQECRHEFALCEAW